MKVLTQKSIKITFFCSFGYKLVCVEDRFSKPVVVFRVENATYEFMKVILKEYEYYKKVIKNTLTKI